MVIVTKHFYVILAKAAPYLGGFVIFASFQNTGDTWTATIWRTAISVALATFVTLVGAIYQNLNRRLEVLEAAARGELLPRKEYEARHEDLKQQLTRIENLVINQAGRK